MRKYEKPKEFRLKSNVKMPGIPVTIVINGEGKTTVFDSEKQVKTTTWLFFDENIMYSKDFVEKNYDLVSE